MAHALALVLHDDPRTVAVTRSVLVAEGFEVVAAESPYRLLEEVADRDPDLVLLGLAGLEDRDLELVAILRRRCRKAALLALFPALLRERAARALDYGADGYLPEPFYPGELASMARAVVARGLASGPSARPESRAADESLFRLAAGIAHSVRNPLQIVELQLGGFETDGKLDLVGVRMQLARVAAVAESRTRFSGRRKLSTSVVDVNALVKRACAEGPKRPRPVRLDLGAARIEVMGSSDLLQAAVEAVHDRAQRLTPAGGTVVVATSLATDRGAASAEVTVTDGGPRLDPASLATLFDPFPDADRVVEGSGMEMAAAAGIVRNHGGSVSARAGRESGTTVVLRLPARNADGKIPPAEAR